MSPLLIELIGIFSTVLVLVSMLFKTTTVKGSLLMRWFNLVGGLIFMCYGILLPAISTAVLNGALVIVNIYHLILLYREKKTEKTK